MKVVVCAKLVPDAEDVSVDRNGNIDISKAHWGISDYDVQALEAGRALAEETDGTVVVLTAGPASIEKGALKKDLLSRGPEELYIVADDALAHADTFQTVAVLAAAVKEIGADVVICGEGSADRYAQQTGVQLGETLGWATVNAVDAIVPNGAALTVDRLLEKEIEIVEVPLPAVLTVTSSINDPEIPKMKAILAAGKKPQHELSLANLGGVAQAAVVVDDFSAPAEPDRKKMVFTGTAEETAAALIAQLRQEALI